MDNLLVSNERTLVIFDSVCGGLAECLGLVHGDIKAMTEHRNQLAIIEQQKQLNEESNQSANRIAQTTDLDVTITNKKENNDEEVEDEHPETDTHHLVQLKLLDKRLADSFSQALNMCDQQKTSLNAKKQHYYNNSTSSSSNSTGHHHHQRPSIFQMLLGLKGSSSSSSSNSNSYKSQLSSDMSSKRQARNAKLANKEPVVVAQADQEQDNRVIIDDINRQTRLAMQYSKQLEAHLFKVEDLRARYEMHLKMGLVSRAYSSSSSAHNSPGSLGRHRTPQHYTSSLMVNDTSSLGTSHSSRSSLNLSSWSFTRRNRNVDRKSSQVANGVLINNNNNCGGVDNNLCCQMAADDSLLRNHSAQANQKYVSTISLDSVSRRNKRLTNMPKLISRSSQQQQQQLTSGPNYPGMLETCELQQHATSQAPCQCQQLVMNNGGLEANRDHRTGGLSQYTYGVDMIAQPTTAGLPMANARGGGGGLHDKIFINSQTGARMHKSASHSSLKDKDKRLKAATAAAAASGQPFVGGKTTVKEFIENIERIEGEFETYMGSFLLNIEDIQGFARVCQGDVFEINIKYGQAQKFKTKISVLKDSRQKCDNRQTVFKARINDVISIKAYECKGLGKRLLLGHKLCETCDLFTARSQLMTISLNQTGSIKLNLVITWNPLHMAPSSSLALPPGLDIAHISLPPTPVSSSTLSSLSSGQSLVNGTNTNNNNNINHSNSTTMINIQSSNSIGSGASSTGGRHRTKVPLHQTQQVSPNVVLTASDATENMCMNSKQQQQQQHLHEHPHHRHSHSHQRDLVREQQAKFYQHQHQQHHDMDPTYGYYIPEPDYQTNEIRH